MDGYKVVLAKSVDHDMRGIGKKHLERIIQVIRSLSQDPFPRACKKLKGAESSYRVRIGDYRVLYEVDTAEKVVIVCHVRHRKDAYRE